LKDPLAPSGSRRRHCPTAEGLGDVGVGWVAGAAQPGGRHLRWTDCAIIGRVARVEASRVHRHRRGTSSARGEGTPPPPERRTKERIQKHVLDVDRALRRRAQPPGLAVAAGRWALCQPECCGDVVGATATVRCGRADGVAVTVRGAPEPLPLCAHDQPPLREIHRRSMYWGWILGERKRREK
jgi:hypothetical protein